MGQRFRIPPPPRVSVGSAYALAILLPVGALVVEYVLRGWIEHVPFVLFFLVVSLVASIGGWGPGAVAVAVSALLGYAFLATSADLDRREGALLGAALFLPVALLIAGVGAVVRAGFREREAAAQELADAVRLRDEFIAMASHELKTPLTTLRLVVQQMGRVRRGDAVGADERILAVQRHTDRLARLIEDILDVSRITSGQLKLEIGQVDLSETARDVAARFEPDVARVGATITVDAPHGVVGAWDARRLDQVVTNLLSNAVKYGEGTPIHVSVSRRSGEARLVVTDRGKGIAPGDHRRIFQRFERGEHGVGYSGLGLGLWIAHEIVTALGGSIGVDSVPGHGATFTVALPIERVASRPRSQAG
jgi:signal transduction histidine kinase